MPMNERDQIADDILGSEAMMWLMAGANHPETHLSALRPAFEAWQEAGGLSYGTRMMHRAYRGLTDKPCSCSVGQDHDQWGTPYRERD